MQHLDEGLLSELLDGELPGAEQREAEAHLRNCPECRDRLAELKGFMQEADQLVTALDEPAVAQTEGKQLRRRSSYRALAWAASIVLAAGLGYAGRSLFQSQSLNFSPGSATSSKSVGTASGAPRSDAPAPATTTPAPAAPELVANSGVAPTESRRSADRAEESPAARNELTRDAERQPVLRDSLAVDSTALRGQIAGKLAGPPAQRYADASAGAGAPQTQSVAHDSLSREAQDRSALAEADVATAARTRTEKENAASSPSPAPAMLQPRDERLAIQGNRIGTQVIPMEEAIRLLGGSIRLVDSLTPVRVERIGADSAVRVVYLTVGVEFWLDERLAGDDSGNLLQSAQAALQARPADGNRVSWNDLHGFYLTLTGPLPVAELERLKARIR